MAKLDKRFIQSNAVDGTKIRLSNEEFLRARNAGDSADINILKVTSGDKIEFASIPEVTADATTANQLVRKSQLDAVLEGLKPKESTRVASTANIASLSTLLTIDGVTVSAGDRVLVKDQSTPAENGIYVAAVGAWTRATDFDQTTPINEIEGSLVAVQEGTLNAGKVFVQYGTVGTIDTDAITFTFFNSNASLVGGNGTDVTGTTISVDLDTNSGLEFNTGKLRVKVDGTTIENASGTLQVKDGSITEAKLATDVDAESLAISANYDSASATGNVATGNTVEDAIEKVEKKSDTNATNLTAHLNDTVDAHDASAISNVPSGNLAATDMQSAVNELQSDIDTRALASDLTTHTGATSAHGVSGSVVGTSDTQTLTNKSIDADNNTISNLEVDNLKTGVLDTDLSSVSGADDTLASAKAIKSYVDTSISAIPSAAAAKEEIKTLSGTDISNQYVDLALAAVNAASISVTPVGGIMQEKGVDYTVSLTGGAGSVTRITFAGDLASLLIAGDKLVIRYEGN